MNRYVCLGEIANDALIVRRFNEGRRYSCETPHWKTKRLIYGLPRFPIQCFGVISGLRTHLAKTAAEAHAGYVAALLRRCPPLDRFGEYERAMSLPYVVEEIDEPLINPYAHLHE